MPQPKKPLKILVNILTMKNWIKAIDWKSLTPHLIVIGVFGVLSLLFYYPLLSGKVLLQSDIQQYEGMARQLNEVREKTGHETYWIDNAFGGMPTYQLGVKYPLDVLTPFYQIFRVFPRPAHLLFLYFFCSYILLLVWGLSWRVGLLGALGFGFSTYLLIILQVGHNTKAEAIAYMPLVLAGFFMVLNRNQRWGWLLSILALGLQIRANHYQMTYYLILLMGVLVLVYGVAAFKDKTLKVFGKKVLIFSSAALLALGLNATPLLATAEYTQYSTRGPSTLKFSPEGLPKAQESGLDYDYITQYSYGIFESLNLIVPRVLGGGSREDLGTDSELYSFLIQQGVPRSQADEFIKAVPTYWGDQPILEAPAYVGISIVFLAFLALFSLKGRKKRWLLAAILMSLVLSWGKNVSVITQFLIDYFPLYNKFRAVSSAQVILELCFPVLAALGVSQWLKKSSQFPFNKTLRAAAIFMGGLVVLYLSQGMLTYSGPIDQMLEQAYGPVFMDQIVAARKTIFNEDVLRALAFCTAILVLIYFLKIQKIKPTTFISLLLVVIMADLWGIAERYTDRSNFVTKRQYQAQHYPTPADQTILQDTTRYRVYEPDLRLSGARTAYFHNAIGGYHGAKLRRFQEAYDYFVAHQIEGFLDMLNTKYVLFSDEGGSPKALINPNALGNAWTVDSLIVVGSADEELQALKTLDFKNHATINYEDYEKLNGLMPQKDSLASIQLITNKPQKLVYNFDAASDQFVVFSEIYYPKGWEVTIDEKPTSYYPVNYILRGLYVPKGKHIISFEFKPSFIFYGSLARGLSLMLILIILAFFVFQQYNNTQAYGHHR
jgi:hypothetical protein